MQDKIVKAAHQLAQDKTVAKSVRKKRKQSYHRAVQKVNKIDPGYVMFVYLIKNSYFTR